MPSDPGWIQDLVVLRKEQLRPCGRGHRAVSNLTSVLWEVEVDVIVLKDFPDWDFKNILERMNIKTPELQVSARLLNIRSGKVLQSAEIMENHEFDDIQARGGRG